MRISNAVVVTPGGIGTLLELFYTWQLIQVDHIKPMPILLLGGDGMWEELIDWLAKWPTAMELMSKEDLSYLILCPTVADALSYLEPKIKEFQKSRATREKIEL